MTTDEELLAELKATPLDDDSFIGIHRIGCAARAAIPRMLAILEGRERERDGFRDLFAACSEARDAAGYLGSVPERTAALIAERDAALADVASLAGKPPGHWKENLFAAHQERRAAISRAKKAEAERDSANKEKDSVWMEWCELADQTARAKAERDTALAENARLRAALEQLEWRAKMAGLGEMQAIARAALSSQVTLDNSESGSTAPEPPVSGWLPIEAAPSAKSVLVAYKNRCDKWRVVKAVRYEQYQNEQPADGADDEGEVGEYCEEKDAYFVRAGWYELIDNWDDFGFVAIYEGDPVAWMNLPAPPKQQEPK